MVQCGWLCLDNMVDWDQLFTQHGSHCGPLMRLLHVDTDDSPVTVNAAKFTWRYVFFKSSKSGAAGW